MKTLKNYIMNIVSFVLFIVISGCTKNNPDTSSLYIPTSADVTLNATLSELQQGRDLYINNCGRCHNLYSPDNYSPSQWKVVMNSMTPRTSLSNAEIQLVTKYVSKGKQ
jgi:hypothetical protein